MDGPDISRRRFLQGGLGLAIGSSAGCIESRSPYAPPVVSDRPDAVYVPSHFEEMAPVGSAVSGPLEAALIYSYPHRFWLLSGTDRSRVRIRPEDSLHLMVMLWDRATGIPVTGTSPQVTVERDGSVVADRIFWQMLSQRMGVHYGDNLQLDGDGTYSITVVVPPTTDRTAPAFGDRLAGHARFDFTLEFSQADLESLAINSVPDDRAGTEGALEPMMGGPAPLARVPDDLPGTPLGTVESGGMELSASIQQDGDGRVLVLTVETPYNKYPLPMLGPVANVGGTRTRFAAALDPTIGSHYRVALPESASGPLEVAFPSPPQVARHEGYETAFMQPAPVTFDLA